MLRHACGYALANRGTTLGLYKPISGHGAIYRLVTDAVQGLLADLSGSLAGLLRKPIVQIDLDPQLFRLVCQLLNQFGIGKPGNIVRFLLFAVIDVELLQVSSSFSRFPGAAIDFRRDPASQSL